MEFIKKIPQMYATRIVTKFLLLPKTLYTNGGEVTKWLEMATWKELRVAEEWRATKFLD